MIHEMEFSALLLTLSGVAPNVLISDLENASQQDLNGSMHKPKMYVNEQFWNWENSLGLDAVFEIKHNGNSHIFNKQRQT